jgi:hypothetical protein
MDMLFDNERVSLGENQIAMWSWLRFRIGAVPDEVGFLPLEWVTRLTVEKALWIGPKRKPPEFKLTVT